MNKNVKCLMAIAIVLVSISACLVIFNKGDLVVDYEENVQVEAGSDTSVSQIIKSIKNGSIINKDEKIDTSKLGSSEVVVKVKDKDGKSSEYKINVEVVDTKAPKINAQKEVTLPLGSSDTLLEGVSANDNYDSDVVVSVRGEYDLDEVGSYSLEYYATDSSGNEGVLAFTLNVVNKDNYTFKTSKGFTAKVIDGVTYIDGIVIVNKTYGLPSSYGDGLTEETLNAFYKMQSDADNEGLNLYLSSGFRDYETQEIIYNRYVNEDGKEAADTYSARPGYSEHQSGFTFDLNSIDDSFALTPEGEWVHNNAYKYGFILRYPNGKDDITGYKYESWHLRYVGEELASKLFNNGDWITLEEYFGIDSKYKD